MKKLIIGVLAVLLTVSPAVLADTIPVGAQPGNIEPQIYLIEKFFDIGCGPDEIPGGSCPDGFDIQMDGSVTPAPYPRPNEYAFTGEDVIELVIVRDLNGAGDLSYAGVTVGGYTEARCLELAVGESRSVTLHNGQQVLLPSDVPPAKDAADEPGFDPNFDKVYECTWTVEPMWYGLMPVNIEAYDIWGAVSTQRISQQWFMNPLISIDLSTNDGSPGIEFESGVPGQTVYSENNLVVTNLAEGGAALRAWVGASDLTDPSHALVACPYSNVLDVDAMFKGFVYDGATWGMEYRGKQGVSDDNLGAWHPITNKDPSDGCHFAPGQTCHGLQDIVWGGTIEEQVIDNMAHAQVWFRLTYPRACSGSYTDGKIYIVVKAV